MATGSVWRKTLGISIIVILLAIYVILAWTAVRGKSATYDEPPSVAVSWEAWHRGDFRADYEQPPLLKYWVGLALPARVNANPTAQSAWKQIANTPMSKWKWAINWLFFSNNPSLSMIARCRAMTLVWAVVLGCVIAWWAWKLAGPVAAVLAAFAFVLAPNFLAHGPLVKNDVAAALVIFAAMFGVWSVGRKCTVWRVILLGVLCGIAVGVKFSSLIIFPIVLVLLIARGIQRKQLGRMIAACIAVGVISYGAIWGMYRFRYSAAPDAGVRIDMRRIIELEALRAFYARDPLHRPTDAQLAAWNPGAVANAALWANAHHLLPEAFIAGLLWTGRTMQGEWTYLLGKITFIAPWYYFPIAIGVKTPLATLVAGWAALMWFICRWKKIRPPWGWSAVCLVVPMLVFLAAAMASRTALGIRYVFPIYPFAFVLIGAAGAVVWKSIVGRVVIVILMAGLAAESLAAYPNYIPFFNQIAGGARGGINWLGDSNLDWGQDLPLLAQWEQAHPGQTVYFSYFGTADPHAYGVQYKNLLGGFPFGPAPHWPQDRCIMAISATNLQGIYDRADPYAVFRSQTPLAILGGSIYLYRYSPRAVRLPNQ